MSSGDGFDNDNVGDDGVNTECTTDDGVLTCSDPVRCSGGILMLNVVLEDFFILPCFGVVGTAAGFRSSMAGARDSSLIVLGGDFCFRCRFGFGGFEIPAAASCSFLRSQAC